MLIAITCPACRHRGHIPHDMLPRSLKCSRCGHRERFERKAPRGRFELEAPSRGGTMPPMRPRLPSFVERAQVPDDLARLLWGKED
jgi:DNA-directed RNA polymerase subunit RPC12/RpoP